MSLITQEELDKLNSTRNEKEWNSICDQIKLAHGGYPSDWFAKVIVSGLLAKVAIQWVKQSTIL